MAKTIDWRWLLFSVAMLAVAGLAMLTWQRSTAPVIDPSRIRAACEQYASLDLSGWAPICRDAGYQQVMPEDLGR